MLFRSKGATGSTGAAGTAGTKGSTGATGATGAAGVSVSVGTTTTGAAGSMTYNQADGAVLNGGTNKLIATFYPNDTVNYETVSRTNNLVVTKVAATVTLLSQSNLFTGFPIPATNTATVPAGLTLKLKYNGSQIGRAHV